VKSLIISKDGYIFQSVSDYGKHLLLSDLAFKVKISEDKEKDLKKWMDDIGHTSNVSYFFEEEKNKIDVWVSSISGGIIKAEKFKLS
jgi:hypothetical protein